MVNVFDTNFVQSLNSEIEKQVASGNKVTRSSVLTALGHEANADLELAISLAFRLGLLPGFKMYQKVGIKSADFVPRRQQPKSPRKRKAKKEEPATTETAVVAEETVTEAVA